jgi:ABC-type nitrate/sulfonate/bicarbonate transport system substrate-binding protein
MDGAILPPPFSVQAEKMSLHRLIGAGEVPEIVEGKIAFPPPAGLGTHSDKVESQPQQISRIVRATLKAQDFIRTRRDDTIRIISDWLKVDRSIASGSYEAYIASSSSEGWVPDSFMESVIEQQRHALKVAEKIPARKVVDFKIVKEALLELRR